MSSRLCVSAEKFPLFNTKALRLEDTKFLKLESNKKPLSRGEGLGGYDVNRLFHLLSARLVVSAMEAGDLAC